MRVVRCGIRFGRARLSHRAGALHKQVGLVTVPNGGCHWLLPHTRARLGAGTASGTTSGPLTPRFRLALILIAATATVAAWVSRIVVDCLTAAIIVVATITTATVRTRFTT